MKHLLFTILLTFACLAGRAADTLVTPPAAGEAKTYHATGYSYAHGDNRAFSINILRDGTDIYIQGLYDLLPEAWLKGTMGSDNVARIPSGQYVGEVNPASVDDSHEDFDVYMFCSTDLKTTQDLEIEYNPENDTWEAYYQYILFSERDDIRMRFEHLQNLTFFSGQTIVTTVPEGLTTQPYHLTAYECSEGKDLDYGVEVGFAQDAIYVRGISSVFPDAWVRGDIVGTKVYFMRNQYLGDYSIGTKTYNIWMTGINHDEAYFTAAEFDYDATTGTLTQIEGNWLVINGDPVLWKWLNNLSDVVISPAEDNETDYYTLMTPPVGLPLYPFTLTANDMTFGTADALPPYEVQMTFDGTDVYVQGLFSEIPDAWVKGSFDGTTLTFASPQYLGMWYGALDCWMMGSTADFEPTDVVFTYDATQSVFTLKEGTEIFFNDTFSAPSEMALQMLSNVTLKSNLAEAIRPLTITPSESRRPYSLNGQRCQPRRNGITVLPEGRKVIAN